MFCIVVSEHALVEMIDAYGLSVLLCASISYYNYFFPSLDETEHEKLYGEAG